MSSSPPSRNGISAISSVSTGKLFKTQTGELSVLADTLTMITKSLRPLPEKWHGLTDVETRYRQRYVDLIVTPETRDTSSANGSRSSGWSANI